MIPEDTDGFRALLSGDKAELHSDGFVQIVLQQSVVIVYGDADHRRVDDRTLRHAGDGESTQKLKHLHQSYTMIPIPAPLECLPQASLVGIVALW